MLEETKTTIGCERSSRREPLGDAEVRALLGLVDRVVIARGVKATTFEARQVKPADLVGPTGNYRAPIVRRGRTLLVGFNDAMLRGLL